MIDHVSLGVRDLARATDFYRQVLGTIGWQLHDAMFLDQQNLTIEDLKSKAATLSLNATTFSSCLDSGKHAAIIRDSIAEGSTAGVDGTPALFINGRYLGGNQPYDEIAKIIEDELTRSGK